MSKFGCDQCTAMMIQGVFCHETGCPNSRKKWNGEEWVAVFKCYECGELVEEGEVCECQEEVYV